MSAKPIEPKSGIAGALTRSFITSPLTPLALFAALILGLIALVTLPREEEPQISVPMVDIMVPANGLHAEDAVKLVTEPLETIVKSIPGVEHVYSQTRDDATMVTARFVVGTSADAAILRVHEKISANIDRIPKGIPEPLIVGRGIDDVAIMVLTLSPKAEAAARWTPSDLTRVAHEVQVAVASLPEIGLTYIVGETPEEIRIEPDPERLAQAGLTLQALAGKVEGAKGIRCHARELGQSVDLLLERALEITDQARGGDLERLHDRVSHAAGQRRELGVRLGEPLDAIGQRADLLEQRLAATRPLRRDIGARQIEQIRHVRRHLAVEPAHRAVGPLIAVLVGSQVVLDQEPDRLALVAREREPLVDLVEHPRADLGVAVEVDALGGERARRDLADVVEQRGPPDQRALDGLPDHLLGVVPHVLVLAPGLLDQIHRGRQLGEQHAERRRDPQPLQRGVDVPPHQHLLHRGAQPALVRVREAVRVFAHHVGHAAGRPAALLVRDRSRDLEEHDGVSLQEGAHPICGCGLAGHRPRSYHGFVEF